MTGNKKQKIFIIRKFIALRDNFNNLGSRMTQSLITQQNCSDAGSCNFIVLETAGLASMADRLGGGNEGIGGD